MSSPFDEESPSATVGSPNDMSGLTETSSVASTVEASNTSTSTPTTSTPSPTPYSSAPDVPSSTEAPDDQEALSAPVVVTERNDSDVETAAKAITDVEEANVYVDRTVDLAVPAPGIDDPVNKTEAQSPTKTIIDESFSSENSHAVVNAGNSSKKNKKNSRRAIYVCALLALLAAVGGVIAILFGVGIIGGSEQREQVPDGTEPTPAPTVIDTAATPAPTAVDVVVAPPPTEVDVVVTPAPTEVDVVVTPAPTPAPTLAPTSANAFLGDLVSPLAGDALNEPTSPQSLAYALLLETWQEPRETTIATKVEQRFAMYTTYISLTETTEISLIPSYVADSDECDWVWVTCDTVNVFSDLAPVVKMELAQRPDLVTGEIPAQIGLLSALTHLDLSENNLRGSIPEEMYNLSQLKYLYLHNNAMTGMLSESIERLPLLEDLFLGHNQFSGPIPQNLKSLSDGIRPLRYLILGHNQFTGSIPSGLRLRQLFYLDLSFNKLSGELPADLGETFVRLRNLYLDHNEFFGTVPESYASVGNDRLSDLWMNNNKLTGAIPSAWSKGNLHLLTLKVHNNDFTQSIDKDVCKLSVLDSGELVDLAADCNICSCDDFCDNCYGSN